MPNVDAQFLSAAYSAPPGNKKTTRFTGLLEKRLKGLEPSTFCMASRRSSQLSYSRASGDYRADARSRQARAG